MFGYLRDPNGRFSSLAVGLALLAVAGLALVLPLPGRLRWVFAFGLGAAALVNVALWWKRQRDARYDLRRLWDAPPPEIEEPYEDTVPREMVGAPYCGWCDEAYAPGTHRCRQCGREL